MLIKKKSFSISIDVDTLVIDSMSNDFTLARRSFTEFIPRILSLFDQYNIKVTVFVIAKFARDKVIAKIIREISNNGHEIANHSLSHCKHLSHFSYEDVYREIEQADKILADVTGKRICGFRAPGYSLSGGILRALNKLGYLYDASLNTSKVYYLLKWIWKNILRSDVDLLNMQPFSHCFLPNRPFFINERHLERGQRASIEGGALLEIPISIVPGVSFPLIGILLNRSKLMARSFNWMVQWSPYKNLLLHDIEFVKAHELNRNKNRLNSLFMAKNMDGRLRLYEQIVQDSWDGHTFTTLGEMAQQFVDNQQMIGAR